MTKTLPLLAASLILASCGYVGDPLPPALNIPRKIEDLSAVQRGSKLIIDFTLPKTTTEDLPITTFESIELRAGISPDPYNFEQWQQTSTPVSVTQLEPGHVQAEASALGFAGHDVLVAVRSVNKKGRTSDWSNVAVVNVLKPLPAPAELKATSVAEGVRLTWQAIPEATYRVFRNGQQAAESTSAEFTDKATEIGKSYEYQVQAFINKAESELSATAAIIPADIFPPAVPKGLSALAGVNTIELTWERNTEEDLRGYKVYRENAPGQYAALGDLVELPSFSDRSVMSGKLYRYAVSSVDRSGNESARSQPVETTAP